MIKDFSIRHVSTLISVNGEIDLHCDVDLEKVIVSRLAKRIEMFWCPTPISESKARLRITFEGVKRFIMNAEGRDNSQYAALSYIGYITNKDFGITDPFLLEEDFDADSTIVLYFEDESFILVDARFAHAIIESNHATVARIS